MIIKQFSKDMYITAILVLVYGIVFFYSLLNYNIRCSILLIAIAMELAMPLLFRDYTVNITSCKMVWVVALCIALIEMSRCIVNDKHATMYFIFVLLLFFITKNDWFKSFQFSEKLIFYMGVFFAAFTIFGVIFTDFYGSMIVPLLRTNGSWDILTGMRLGSHSGLTNQPSINAVYIAFGIGASFISFMFEERKKNKILLSILIAVEFGCILLTSKRGALIYTLITILMVYYYNSSKGEKITNFVKLILSLIVVLFFIYFAFPAANLFLTTFLEGKSQIGDISNGRYTLYEAAWQFFGDNMLFGIGWTNFRYSYFRFIDVHNIYLQLLCETGVVGAILFYIAFIYTYISSLMKMNWLREIGGPAYRLMLLSLYLQTFFLLHGMTSNALYDYFISFFYFFAVLISVNINIQDEVMNLHNAT